MPVYRCTHVSDVTGLRCQRSAGHKNKKHSYEPRDWCAHPDCREIKPAPNHNYCSLHGGADKKAGRSTSAGNLPYREESRQKNKRKALLRSRARELGVGR